MAEPRTSDGPKILTTLASIVLILACLYWAQKIFIPLTLAVLLAFILSPLVLRLQRLGLNRILSVIVVVFLTSSLLACLAWGAGTQLRNLLDELPQHRQEIDAKIEQLRDFSPGPLTNFFDMLKDITSKLRAEGAPVGENPAGASYVVYDRSPWMNWFASAAGSVLELLLGSFFVGILVVFLLVRREDLRNRFFQAIGTRQLTMMTRAVDEAAHRISSYLMTQLMVNATLGLVWSLCLLVVPNGSGGYGLPYAFLWGALLTALRFIPYLGTWVALAFPLLLSLALAPIAHPLLQPLLLMCIFVLLELFTANVLEPLLFGHHAGVAPVALLIAAVFWAWLWGPMGLVLSTPLTVCLVVLGKYVPQLRLLYVFLGTETAAEVDTTYYQRLLVRDEDEATDVVQTYLKTHPLECVYDDVLLPALVIMMRNEERGTLGPSDQVFVMEVTGRILDEVLVHEPRLKLACVQKTASVDGRALVLGCSARGAADEMALRMLAQILRAEKYDMKIVSFQKLASEVIDAVHNAEPLVVCISGMPPGGLAQASYLCKRLHMEFPNLTILVGRWGQTENIDRAKSRLLEAGATRVVTTLHDMRHELLPLLKLKAPRPETTTAPELTAV